MRVAWALPLAMVVLAGCGRGAGDTSGGSTAALPAFPPVRPPAYKADGGADDFHGTGVICDLTKPFVISGGGVTVRFTPKGDGAGDYDYDGSLEGFAVFGKGTFKIALAPDGASGKINAEGPGSVKTPMGVQTRHGEEVYTLTKAEPCDPATLSTGGADTAATAANP